MKKQELTKTIMPQPVDEKFSNQVVKQKRWRGFLNPIESNPTLIGPYRAPKE